MRLIDKDKTMEEIPIDVCDGFEVTDIIEKIPTVKAIPLDRIKQAREEMVAYIEPTTGQWTSGFNNGVNTCIEILDRLIAESEEK